MTLGSGRGPVALSAKQLSRARQGSRPKYRRGDQPKGNGYKFHAEREDRDAGKTPRLAGEQHTQDRRVESNEKGKGFEEAKFVRTRYGRPAGRHVS